MDEFDYWRLCDDISVFQAILLTLDINPTHHEAFDWERGNSRFDIPAGYKALKTAIQAGIERGSIDGSIHYSLYDDFNGNINNQGERYMNLDVSQVNVWSYTKFLEEKKFKSSRFFFPDNTDNRDYLDKNHPHYSPKLAMSIKAWEAIRDNPSLLNNKTAKTALTKWLKENASTYGFTDGNGDPLKQPIEEMAKVGNWNPKGGVAKTHVPTKISNPPPNQPIDNDDDFDESSIPF